ncbi:MAG: murein hydrolase activator EnvC family protein [Flavobacteriales bacterium]|jgi:septal ring factor EnvC (AmiA/AmiB activator)
MKNLKTTSPRFFIITALIAVAIFIIPLCAVVGQSKKDLQKQRDEINDKIEQTKKMIRDSERQQKSTIRQVQLLNEQLAFREQLLSNINNDIHSIDGEIKKKNHYIGEMEQQVDQMKREYGSMIYNAFRQRSSYDKLMYIFASADFHQAYKRLKMTQRYADARKKQAFMILGKQEEIKSNITELERDKQSKARLADAKEKEKLEVEADKVEQQKRLQSLKKEESKLRKQQDKQKADRDKLTARIQAVIAEEIRKENAKKMEEEKKAAAAAKATAEKSTSGSTSTAGKTTTTSTSTSTGTTAAAPAAKKTAAVALAPETVLVNKDFEKNKGALPWPVSAGVITSHFGKHAHPSLAQVVVNNNGVDFTTEKGANALAIFGGKVTSIFTIPGAGQNVIVTHGSYKTVYSGLETVAVKIGDALTTKQKLGTIMYDGEDYTLHFEVWKVGADAGAAQNPELWIKKR